jgi:hypothetical protein
VVAPDFWNMIAIDRGMPEGWRWWSVKVLGSPTTPREHAAALVKGAVPTVRFKTGRRAGEINWAKASGKAEMVITFRDFDERALRWERETGKCKDCGGDGLAFAGWSGADGTSSRPCARCRATGKAPPP